MKGKSRCLFSGCKGVVYSDGPWCLRCAELFAAEGIRRARVVQRRQLQGRPMTNEDFLREFGGREKGAAALFENRFDEYAVGVQARLGVGDDATRYGGGAYGKAWIPAIKALLMADQAEELRNCQGCEAVPLCVPFQSEST